MSSTLVTQQAKVKIKTLKTYQIFKYQISSFSLNPEPKKKLMLKQNEN